MFSIPQPPGSIIWQYHAHVLENFGPIDSIELLVWGRTSSSTYYSTQLLNIIQDENMEQVNRTGGSVPQHEEPPVNELRIVP